MNDVPLPHVEDPDALGFWQAARERRLVVQRCPRCGHRQFPPHAYCAECTHPQMEWQELSGRGRIWSFGVVHAPTLPQLAQWVPFPIVVVEMEEDSRIRMVGNVVAAEGAPINSVDPASIRVGGAVEVTFADVGDDVTLPRWLLRGEEARA